MERFLTKRGESLSSLAIAHRTRASNTLESCIILSFHQFYYSSQKKERKGRQTSNTIVYQRAFFLLCIFLLLLCFFFLYVSLRLPSLNLALPRSYLLAFPPSLPPSTFTSSLPAAVSASKPPAATPSSSASAPTQSPASGSGVILIFLDQVGREGGREGGPTSTSSLPAAASDSKPPAATPSASASVRGPSLPVAPV